MIEVQCVIYVDFHVEEEISNKILSWDDISKPPIIVWCLLFYGEYIQCKLIGFLLWFYVIIFILEHKKTAICWKDEQSIISQMS